jgi:hypothetical protein
MSYPLVIRLMLAMTLMPDSSCCEVPGGREGFLVGGDRGAVFPAQRAGGGVPAAERGGFAGAHQLGGSEPRPGFLDDQPRAAGAQDRAGGAVPGAGDRRLVLPERGLRRAPPERPAT